MSALEVPFKRIFWPVVFQIALMTAMPLIWYRANFDGAQLVAKGAIAANTIGTALLTSITLLAIFDAQTARGMHQPYALDTLWLKVRKQNIATAVILTSTIVVWYTIGQAYLTGALIVLGFVASLCTVYTSLGYDIYYDHSLATLMKYISKVRADPSLLKVHPKVTAEAVHLIAKGTLLLFIRVDRNNKELPSVTWYLLRVERDGFRVVQNNIGPVRPIGALLSKTDVLYGLYYLPPELQDAETAFGLSVISRTVSHS